MKYCLSLLFLIFGYGCKEQTKIEVLSEEPRFMINLIDSLGRISIQFPANTDTFFSWICRSDCGTPCEEGKYRFQPGKRRIFKGSGFFWEGQPKDSVYQLTISHSRFIVFKKSPDSIFLKARFPLEQELKANPETRKTNFDKILKINDRNFLIFRNEDIDSARNVYIRRLFGYTSIYNTWVEFRYDLLSQNKDSLYFNFFEHAMSNLQTVEIHGGG
jgi:hypothetical protein